LPIFGSDKVSYIARNVKAFLNPEGDAAPDAGRHEDRVEDPNSARQQRISEQKEMLKSKRQELRKIRKDTFAAKDGAERAEHVKRAKKKKLELLELKNELRAAREEAEGVPEVGTVPPPEGEEPQTTGALPDFVVIGAAKCGTTFFYHLLTQHPLVEPAAFKEPHYFDLLFEEEGVEWYRRCFPQPRWQDGRWTITGEASPGYIFHPHVAERMAKVVPQARLIALLRNPVDRTYSAYHHRVRNGQETRTFAEALEAYFADPRQEHLSKSIYVDHLLRWAEFFPREQMLVLKSEDFFESPNETLKIAFAFLELPEWEPEASQLANKRNPGSYEGGMDPVLWRKLEEYFEPHNKRLYDYLGVDFGW
jgi:hypothetical protein